MRKKTLGAPPPPVPVAATAKVALAPIGTVCEFGKRVIVGCAHATGAREATAAKK